MSPPFPRILCAVDGSEGANIALEHAFELAADDARVTLVSVWSDAAGEPRASGALELAAARAREAGVHAVRRLLHGAPVADALAAGASGFDLMVARTHPHARVTSALSGETATGWPIARRCPLLWRARARWRRDARRHGRAPGHAPPLTAAARVAARVGSELTVLHVREADESARRAELEAELANLRALLGHGIRYITDFGGAAARIVAAAEAERAGLVVVGSGAKHGVAALASTSERVATMRRARC